MASILVVVNGRQDRDKNCASGSNDVVILLSKRRGRWRASIRLSCPYVLSDEVLVPLASVAMQVEDSRHSVRDKLL